MPHCQQPQHQNAAALVLTESAVSVHIHAPPAAAAPPHMHTAAAAIQA